MYGLSVHNRYIDLIQISMGSHVVPLRTEVPMQKWGRCPSKIPEPRHLKPFFLLFFPSILSLYEILKKATVSSDMTATDQSLIRIKLDTEKKQRKTTKCNQQRQKCLLSRTHLLSVSSSSCGHFVRRMSLPSNSTLLPNCLS